MTQQLVLEVPDRDGERAVGDNVFLADLDEDYCVYAFVYPGAMPDEALEARLRALGEQTGHNLFVNIARLDDPALGRIAEEFGIRSYPVIVMTAAPVLAAHGAEQLTAFVRIDNAKLFADPDHLVTLVAEMFTLFLTGDVAAAMALDAHADRRQRLAAVAGVVLGGLRRVLKWVADRDVVVSFVEGRFELKRSAAT